MSEEQAMAAEQMDEDMTGEIPQQHSDAVCYFAGHDGPVYAVSSSSSSTDPLLLCTGGGDDRAFLVRGEEGRVLAELEGHGESVVATAFNFDNSLVATACLDGVIRVYRTTENAMGKLIATCEGSSEGAEWLAWHPKGNVIMGGFGDGTCWLWHIKTTAGQEDARYMATLTGHSGAVTCGGFTIDGKGVISAGHDGSIRLWNPITGAATAVLSGPEFHGDTPVTCLTVHPNGQLLLTGDLEGNVVVTNIQSARAMAKLRTTPTVENPDFPPSVEAIAASPKHAVVAACDNDGHFILINMTNLTVRHSISLGEHGVSRLAFLGTSPIVAAASLTGTLMLYNSLTGALERTLQGHDSMVLTMAVSAPATVSVDDAAEVTGRFLVSGSDDGVVLTFGPFVTE
ncbi:WD domain, G-beta repeat [Carpediemonas membranifera]|uniref:WD domain, G-beta repeat n=1 Tax=Carpediemonas membranifera TaxID=201153 RepID=A0A8J6AXL2_9EUKA|nr:WD domain, G-beta repeat [Carpediemonas membranifera]|eukprot:KAG9396643.1 WD domain, G-beta repeat [Carpediemonas membranifera]